jgi:RNA polymerase sigma factor (sigma-70 family)
MRFRGSSTDRREAAIEEHMPLVHSVARRYARSGETPEELARVGTAGLVKAVDRFGAQYGLEFSTLAVEAIDDEIQAHLQGREEYDPRPMPAVVQVQAQQEAARPNRWLMIALAANFAVVTLAVIVGIVLLIVALSHGF